MSDLTEIEVKATKMGWIPQDQFRGDLSKWRPAEEYLQRGEELLPILRASNKDLHTKLDTTAAQVQTLTGELQKAQELLAASQESITALKEFNSTSIRAQAKEQSKELKAAIVQARTDGDVEKEVELTEQLTIHNAALKEAEKPSAKVVDLKPVDKPKPEADPQFIAWCNENEWYGKDLRRTALANGIAAEMKKAGDTRIGRVFLDDVAAEVEKTLGGNPARKAAGKVDVNERTNGGSGSGGGAGSARGYSDLPADAKEVCERQAKRLVGEGRAYKTPGEWRKAYADRYFAEEG